ncbi:flavin reductase [Acuticoccus mangrovi]|uniref:Flavin reductase n=1 Tax=Acuticoccus mangrovi TaxID=2796142 RepID=A0A934ICK6_9HYPH|nr:flavin reductase [Acuticoccus mangrovi]MBJ3774063.1 flavin reductase [Acuticoccus mangrovi]
MSTCTTYASSDPEVAGTWPPVEKAAFRHSMSRLAAAVNIITSVGEDGWCGFTASAVTSVTDEPPTLLVCINRTTQAHKSILSSRVLCVNTVSKPHEELSMVFAGSGGNKDMVKRFAAANWTTLATGAPVLEDAIVAFDCRVTQLVEVGTHDVMICEVVAVRDNEHAGGLVYFGRRFHHVV